MADTSLVDHVFFVLGLFGVGLWSIVVLGLPGFTERGVPYVPPSWSHGVRGRLLGGLLVAIGGAFVTLSLLGLALLVQRLG